jgi:lysozyme
MAKKNPMYAVKAKQKTKNKTPKKKQKKGKGSSNIKWILGISLTISLAAIIFFFMREIKPLTSNTFRETVPKGFASIGLDVSHHQGEIDWKKLMTDSGFDTLIHFVYCKATEGNTHFDRQWVRNRSILNEMGIPNGAYHFFTPKEPAIPQAEHFLNRWVKRDIDLPPVLDVETEGFSDQELIANMKMWLDYVEKKSGMRPIIYTSLNYFETKFQNEFLNYKFWIAAYSRIPACIEDKRIVHWQYSESGRLPGIREKVDLNVSKLSF